MIIQGFHLKRTKSKSLLGLKSTPKSSLDYCSIHPQPPSNITGLLRKLSKLRKTDPPVTTTPRNGMIRDTTGSLELSDLWRDETIILKVIGSSQCPRCLSEARELRDFLLTEECTSIKLVAVLQNPLQLKDYFQGALWDWELVRDDNNVVTNFLDMDSNYKFTRQSAPIKKSPSLGKDSTFIIAPGGRILSSFKHSFDPTSLSCLI